MLKGGFSHNASLWAGLAAHQISHRGESGSRYESAGLRRRLNGSAS